MFGGRLKVNETTGWHQCLLFPAMHCHCFFGDRKDVQAVKKSVPCIHAVSLEE